MLGVVLGNGPSKQYFDRKGDYIVGCNIPGDEFSVDATVICDEEIVWVLKNDSSLITCPVIVSTKAYEKMKELRIDGNFYIHHVFETKDWYNSAHYAAEFLLGFGCDELNVWGCDSIFTDDISSTTDVYVKKESDTMRFVKKWRGVWHDIFERYPTANIQAMRIEQ
jgi:hypothetical protein